MKSFEEIVATAFTHEVADHSSDPAISACQEFASDGRFEEMARFLNIWLKEYSHASVFLIGKIPGIVLNRYVYKRPELSSSKIEAWLDANPTWAEQLKSVCQDLGKFSFAVSNMCESIYSDACAKT